MTFYRRPPQSDLPVRPPEEDKPPYLKWLLIILTGCILVFIIKMNQPQRHLVGEVAPEDPQIILMQNAPSFQYKGFVITPIASFTMRARVLGVEYYSWDYEAKLSPVDFAVGWGKMSDSSILDNITITQGNRWYFWSTPDFKDINRDYIVSHSHNIHIIPSSRAIEKVAKNVEKDDIVVLKGYLVSITKQDGYKWVSAVEANTAGAGSCFVLWLESITIK